jgi:hypothetical protein
VVISGGMTVLQPMDASISKLFKDRLNQQYLTWIADPACELRETEKITRASSEVTRWVLAALKPFWREHYCQIFQEVLHKQCFGQIQR